jgi:hypothetical protein
MRHIVADPDQGCGWDHIFLEEGREVKRDTRFVFDVGAGKLIHLDIRRDWKWRAASPAELADLEDSLLNANGDALDDPEGWGLLEMEHLPDWAGDGESPAP